jgi:hypothetical protein
MNSRLVPECFDADDTERENLKKEFDIKSVMLNVLVEPPCLSNHLLARASGRAQFTFSKSGCVPRASKLSPALIRDLESRVSFDMTSVNQPTSSSCRRQLRRRSTDRSKLPYTVQTRGHLDFYKDQIGTYRYGRTLPRR